MRVAVITKHFPDSEQKWAGHSTYQTLRILASMCELRVFYTETVYPKMLKPRSARRQRLDPNWQPEGVNVTYVPCPVLPYVSRVVNGAMVTHKMLPPVRTFRPDVILSYFLYPDGYAAVRVGQKLGVPAVVTAVGSDLNRIPDAICRAWTAKAVREAAFVSAVSADLSRSAIQLGASPETCAPNLNGCDIEIFHARDRVEARRAMGIATEGKTIVYVGRLDFRKGLLELIDAVALLLKSDPTLRCYIVGDGPDRPLLAQAIERHEVEKNIVLVPSCPTQQVAIWMATGDVVTLPSYAEGCPNVVVEALASGRPVVATNVGGIPELMDDSCGRLVPPRDVRALYAALQDVLSKTWNADEIATRHNRSWRDVANDLYRILERVTKPGA